MLAGDMLAGDMVVRWWWARGQSGRRPCSSRCRRAIAALHAQVGPSLTVLHRRYPTCRQASRDVGWRLAALLHRRSALPDVPISPGVRNRRRLDTIRLDHIADRAVSSPPTMSKESSMLSSCCWVVTELHGAAVSGLARAQAAAIVESGWSSAGCARVEASPPKMSPPKMSSCSSWLLLASHWVASLDCSNCAAPSGPGGPSVTGSCPRVSASRAITSLCATAVKAAVALLHALRIALEQIF